MTKQSARETLARTIRSELGANEITVARLHRETGIPLSTLRRKLKGVADFTLNELITIAPVIGVDAADLTELYAESA